MAFVLAGCDDSEALPGRYQVRVIDTYSLIAPSSDDRTITVSPQVEDYAIVGHLVLGSRREITMPRQVLSDDVNYFILNTATSDLESFDEKAAFEEAVISRGITIEAVEFRKTAPSIGE